MKNYTMLNVKLYEDDGKKLTRLYEAAGTDKSTFVRTRIFSDDDIIILDKANYIPRSLIEIGDQLKAAMRDGKLSDELINKTYTKLCDIEHAFITISKELTDFKTQQEVGDE